MKATVTMYCLLIGAILISSCIPKPEVEIRYSLDGVSGFDSRKLIKMEIRNNTKEKIIIPCPGTVEKIGALHPCLQTDIIAGYTKISSHKNHDCIINPGTPLFEYLQTSPFDRDQHMKLWKLALNKTREFDQWFNYLNADYPDSLKFPSFQFVDA